MTNLTAQPSVVLPPMPEPDMGTIQVHAKRPPVSMGYSVEAMQAYALAALEAAPRNERDNCEVCKGTRGGVPGNENVINGVITCDYCSTMQHDSDCAVHNMPAYPKGPCDCQPNPQQLEADKRDSDKRLAMAVYEAVSAIYFDDSSDYKPALLSVIRNITPDLAEMLETNPSTAWHESQARKDRAISAAKSAGGDAK